MGNVNWLKKAQHHEQLKKLVTLPALLLGFSMPTIAIPYAGTGIYLIAKIQDLKKEEYYTRNTLELGVISSIYVSSFLWGVLIFMNTHALRKYHKQMYNICMNKIKNHN